jgi:hypothetical protein
MIISKEQEAFFQDMWEVIGIWWVKFKNRKRQRSWQGIF